METRRLAKLLKIGESFGALPFTWKNSETKISQNKSHIHRWIFVICSQILYAIYLGVRVILLGTTLTKAKTKDPTTMIEFDTCLVYLVCKSGIVLLQVLTISKTLEVCKLVNGWISFAKMFTGISFIVLSINYFLSILFTSLQ